MIRLYDTLKFGYLINKTVDLSGKTMSLDTAKDVLRHLGTNGTGQTISFSNDTWGYIAADEEAIELLEAAYANGWSSNEPDIQIVAASGYNGKVNVNGAVKQLTQSSTNSEVWYGSAGTVTSLSGFIGGDTRSTPHNSTATKVIKARFGKNINTASCTTIKRMFSFWGTNSNTDHFKCADVRHLNTSNVTDMSFAFSQGAGLTTFSIYGIENFYVSKVTTFDYMFNGFIENTLDLHTWHTLANVAVNVTFVQAQTYANRGINPKIYYTPGYWKANLPTVGQMQLTVYPYHDITVAASSGFNGKIYYDGALVDMTYDSSLGIWYKDITTQISGNTLRGAFRASNNSTVANNLLSISLKEINAQAYSLDIFGFAYNATSLRSADIEGFSGKSSTSSNQIMRGNTSLTNIYLPEFGAGHGYSATFMSCSSLRYIKFKENESTNSYLANTFNGCTNLIRISNLPRIENATDTSSAFTGATSLTTIDAAGAIAETIDFSPCPLDLASAKVILSALQTVTSETISFSNTTWAAILDNEEAVDLLEAAYAKGWTSNEPDITIVADSGYDGVVRVNDADKQLTQVGSTGVWIGSAGTVTSMICFLKHDSRSYYNSTSYNVKKVRFGKNINTASCTTLEKAFCCNGSSATNLETIDVSHINSSNVTTMYATFGDISSAGTTKILGLPNLDVAKVTNFAYCFNSGQIKDTLDLHTWHTNVNATNMTGFTRALGNLANDGVNYPVYYTPGYWKASLPDSSRLQPTVYPYHDITIAASSGFGGTCKINETSVNMTQDSTLGIWYYDIPANVTVESLAYCFDGNAYLTSASFKDITSTFSAYRMLRNCTAVKSIDVSNIMQNCTNIHQFGVGTTNLSNIYGLDKIGNINSGTGYIANSNTALRYLKFSSSINSANMRYFVGDDTNLIRISNLPIIPNGIETTNAFINCSSLTTIDASGNIAETIDFSPCPLTLASAKVILNALQTVTSETLTFSSTTKGYINADSEALALVTAARNKGWTIAL